MRGSFLCVPQLAENLLCRAGLNLIKRNTSSCGTLLPVGSDHESELARVNVESVSDGLVLVVFSFMLEGELHQRISISPGIPVIWRPDLFGSDHW